MARWNRWAEGGDGCGDPLIPLYEVLRELLKFGPPAAMGPRLFRQLQSNDELRLFALISSWINREIGAPSAGGYMPICETAEFMRWRQVLQEGASGLAAQEFAKPPNYGWQQVPALTGGPSSQRHPVKGAIKPKRLVLSSRAGVIEAVTKVITQNLNNSREVMVRALSLHPELWMLAIREADAEMLIKQLARKDDVTDELVGPSLARPASLAALAAVTSIATPRVGSRPLTKEEKAVAKQSAIAAIRQPERTQQGKVCWTARQTCAAFLDAFEALQRTGMKQDAALDEIAQAWSTEGNSLKGSSLKKRRTECSRNDPRNEDRMAA